MTLPVPALGASSASVPVVHTDNAGIRLSNSVRRRCFNCSTTDTSTWRRSNLSPGKVLCNTCGLFERTHSRPRPELSPQRRGPPPRPPRSPHGVFKSQASLSCLP
ncbi:hypothetical protein C8R47DRAFT_979489 [Mycena vitilis]|nr:hypothetical protein C8R47DRAFT_979489 [Mycena vitilis]